MKNITILGLGYIGLPTALFFSKSGFNVCAVDINEKIVDQLNDGKITFKEDGLEELFLSTYNNIDFNTKPKEANLFIITVPTPFLKNKTIDEKYINKAFLDISSLLKKGDSIVLESTVPPMITEKLIEKVGMLGFKVGEEIYIGHVPETIIPGNMINEFKTNRRLIGGATKKCSEVVSEFYEQVVKGDIIKTDLRTAEFVKVIENTYRDVNIALANQLMHLSDEMEIDIYEAIKIANMHPRVNIHNPGPGVGGHCISVDPWFLVGIFKEKANLIEMARNINDNQPQYIYDKLIKKHQIKNKKIGVYGLSYKPNIDDFRESPSFTFIDILKKNNNQYISYDPGTMSLVETNQTLSFEKFIQESDLIIIYVNHDHLKENMKLIIDKQMFKI